jgi:hypothetical protein
MADDLLTTTRSARLSTGCGRPFRTSPSREDARGGATRHQTGRGSAGKIVKGGINRSAGRHLPG